MPARHLAFEQFLRSAGSRLAEQRGQAFADEVVTAARVEYERLLPEVPDIGGIRNVFQPVMTVNGWIVALHRAMRERGGTAAEAVGVCQAVVDGWLRLIPGFALHAIGRLALSGPSRFFFERQARRSQARRYTEDFVWQIERSGDGEFSLVFDECAVNKWYEAQDVRELKPYCNFFDVTYSRLMGMGVDATETIGLGCERCALRYKAGRETVVPQSLRGIVAADGDAEGR